MSGVSYMKQFGKLYTLLFTLALTAFCAYALMDTFVITRVYASAEQNENVQANTAAA